MTEKYRVDLDGARADLAELFRQREELETKIAKQQSIVAALATLSDDSEGADDELGLGGLTDAIRAVFRAAGDQPLLAIDVRDRLKQLLVPVDKYQNFLAVIHTTLRRLCDRGELEEHVFLAPGGSGPVGYRWTGSVLNAFERSMRQRTTKAQAIARLKKRGEE
jgi:hypothetical protein